MPKYIISTFILFLGWANVSSAQMMGNNYPKWSRPKFIRIFCFKNMIPHFSIIWIKRLNYSIIFAASNK